MPSFATAAARPTLRRSGAVPAASAPAGGAVCDAVGGLWHPTRLLAGRGRFLLYRARCAGELGPGCYALKRLRPGEPEAALRLAELRREATAAAAINQASLVSVLAANLTRTRPHLILPYLEGASLERLLTVRAGDCDRPAGESQEGGRQAGGGQAGGGRPIHSALAIARQIASALAALHSTGWLHGQVRPRHIIISPQGQATLIDLTQARQLASPEIRLEAAPALPHHYAPPEFLRPGALTAAADVYALGATLFQILTGQPPFASFAGAALAAAHSRRRPPELRRFRPDATLEVAELIFRTLAKEPLRRPAAQELVNWLAELEIAELTRGAH